MENLEATIKIIELLTRLLIIPVLIFFNRLLNAVNKVSEQMSKVRGSIDSLQESMRSLPTRAEFKSDIINVTKLLAPAEEVRGVKTSVEWNRRLIEEQQKTLEKESQDQKKILESFANKLSESLRSIHSHIENVSRGPKC